MVELSVLPADHSLFVYIGRYQISTITVAHLSSLWVAEEYSVNTFYHTCTKEWTMGKQNRYRHLEWKKKTWNLIFHSNMLAKRD